MIQRNPPTALICDLGDVFFNWTPPKVAEVSRSDLVRLLSSPIWDDYERGKYAEEETYNLLEEYSTIAAADIRSTLSAARETLKASPAMFRFLRRLHEAGIKMVVMSNISLPDWEILQTRASEEEWALFDRRFISYVLSC